MESLAKNTVFNEQGTDVHTSCMQRYSELQTSYEHKNIEMIGYKTKANYWEAQFRQLKTREEELVSEVEELKAKLRKREQELFGTSSEKNKKTQDTHPQLKSDPSKRNRGQQPGSKGHGRRDYDHLPIIEVEELELINESARCPCCHKPYKELPGYAESDIVEIDVQAHRRLIRRKNYKRSCFCKKNPDPQIVSAPAIERLLPKSKLGISIWALLLLKKYEYQQPINRTLDELSGHGLSLSAGTVTDGFQKLLPYFIPIYDAIVERSVEAKHWHADETGWKVFETIEGKKNNNWYLWIFHNAETVVYKIHSTRSSEALFEYFGKDHDGGTLNVDRYSAYKVIAKEGLFILAFCWAHVRRDFLDHAKGYVEQETWALSWVERIGKIYHINNARIQHKPQSKLFHEKDVELKKAISEMKKELSDQLTRTELLPSARKILKSLNKHWSGLTIFVDRSEIPMDNNTAERGLRSSVIGRKNYYGSGAIWSSELAAALFTLFKTLKLWKINIHTWLLAYFHECALIGGMPPENINKFLPWEMTEEKRQLLSKPPEYKNSG
ncbi:MAG TPA: IS66 family transposase [Candidatus Saccharimonadales bacterium]|nr:IS66 family transposase [Candidatus Saccharimonadales bacterium]